MYRVIIEKNKNNSTYNGIHRSVKMRYKGQFNFENIE